MLKEEGSCFIGEEHIEMEEGKVSLMRIVDPISGRLMNSSCNEYNNIKA